MARIVVDVDVTRAKAKVASVRGRMDRNQILNAIGREVNEWITTNIRRSGALAGGWPPMAANTRLQHRAPMIRSGALLRSFDWRVMGNVVNIGSPRRYASYMHAGTQPHRIDGNPILRFPTVRGTVHTRSVQHPGTPPRPLLPNRTTARRIGVQVVREHVLGQG